MLNVISDKIYLNGFEVGSITIKEGTSDYDHIVDSILNTKVVQELEQKIKELEDDIWSLNENIETLVNEVSSLEKEVYDLERNNHQLEKEKDELDKRIYDLEDGISRLDNLVKLYESEQVYDEFL